ncbi:MULTISPECIES: DUF2523 family protein [Xanthomonas translucens group]|uniref:DUF2523 domain-containing protein n=2 Tax=Xanthomonas campestris pv. translucens TaxID=343 RepID=A0A120EW37_XANCT|nr:DUF2523 family protein [Xanthomonas translucens]KWV12244.1 hypothetical protein ATB53_18050 [Xanthomonas translucens]QSQ35239.1 DUF2523 domain-containing protein [Xanthomonas translucens pv. translucens]QSQ40410.1 DUF2523 domain-containing protein [Xanthomonas translucens pv. translucens]QSQ44051.1 DUF2523 domain-containing protein [Xanthomonas translucens pv. translucens]QSQ48393.1 DUF2523 domain-containing protein [Xanthomonas translucens pv. undulosa]
MPMIIGALVAMLMQALRQYLPGIVGRILLAFGIGLVTHEVALPAMKAYIASQLPGLGAVGVAYWDASGIGAAVTIILSAIAASLTQRAVLSKIKGSA